MSTSYIPQKIIAGDTLKLSVTLPLYPASDGWVLTLYLRGKDSLDVQSTPQNDAHLIQVAAAATASWAAGPYQYSLKISKLDESYTVCTGNLTIAENPLNIPADFDARSKHQEIIEAIDATLLGQATSNQQQITIGGRQLTKIPILELITLRKYYVNLAKNAAMGGGARTISVGFRGGR